MILSPFKCSEKMSPYGDIELERTEEAHGTEWH
jgi:hypothetical protein